LVVATSVAGCDGKECSGWTDVRDRKPRSWVPGLKRSNTRMVMNRMSNIPSTSGDEVIAIRKLVAEEVGGIDCRLTATDQREK
jgi:hypothetical protein